MSGGSDETAVTDFEADLEALESKVQTLQRGPADGGAARGEARPRAGRSRGGPARDGVAALPGPLASRSGRRVRSEFEAKLVVGPGDATAASGTAARPPTGPARGFAARAAARPFPRTARRSSSAGVWRRCASGRPPPRRSPGSAGRGTASLVRRRRRGTGRARRGRGG